jgi:hypothetical protein
MKLHEEMKRTISLRKPDLNKGPPISTPESAGSENPPIAFLPNPQNSWVAILFEDRFL